MKYTIKKEWSCAYDEIHYYAYDENNRCMEEGSSPEECEAKLRELLTHKITPETVKELEIP